MRFVTMLAVLLLAGCAATRSVPPSPVRAGPAAITGTKAVLVTAEADPKAAADTMAHLARSLTQRGLATDDIQQFSSTGAASAERADLSGVMRVIGTWRAAPGDACVLFLSGQGLRDMGVRFPLSSDYLDARQLDQVLTMGCGSQPTVVVVSACYSGQFGGTAMARDNRIILTAAGRDRSSAGCALWRQPSYFDTCFLNAVDDPRSRTWEDVGHATIACVTERERAHDAPASLPRLVVGSAVAGLPLPGGR